MKMIKLKTVSASWMQYLDLCVIRTTQQKISIDHHRIDTVTVTMQRLNWKHLLQAPYLPDHNNTSRHSMSHTATELTVHPTLLHTHLS